MPMAPYARIDFTARMSVLTALGTALGVPTNQIPSANCPNSNAHCVYWINNFNTKAGLPLLGSLDYTGFVTAVNALAATVA